MGCVCVYFGRAGNALLPAEGCRHGTVARHGVWRHGGWRHGGWRHGALPLQKREGWLPKQRGSGIAWWLEAGRPPSLQKGAGVGNCSSVVLVTRGGLLLSEAAALLTVHALAVVPQHVQVLNCPTTCLHKPPSLSIGSGLTFEQGNESGALASLLARRPTASSPTTGFFLLAACAEQG